MTRPKEIAPFHMLRMDPAYPIRPGPDTTSVAWMLLLGDMFDLPIRQGGRASWRGAAPPGLRSEARATREGGAAKAPWRRAGDRARATREGGAAKAPRRRAGDTS